MVIVTAAARLLNAGVRQKKERRVVTKKAGMSKASVAFDLPASPASSVAPVSRAAARSKSGALNGLLVGIMGIVFGVGIMYLLSRVMQTTRKLSQLERQLKQQNATLEEVITRSVASKPLVGSVPEGISMGPLGIPLGMPSANDMDMLMELLMHDIPLPASCMSPVATGGCQRVEEVVEDPAPVPNATKEKQVASIVEETMKPLHTVVDEIEKQSEPSEDSSSSSSSEDEDKKQVAPPKRTRAPPKRRGPAK